MTRYRSFNSMLLAAAVLTFAAFAANPALALIVDYEPGQAPPPDIWTVPNPAPVAQGPAPVVDIELNAAGNAPALQPAHNGRYTALGGPLHMLDYRQHGDGTADITVLLVDGSYGTALGVPAGRAQLLLTLRSGGKDVGSIKIGTVATLGSPPPKAGVEQPAYGGDLPKSGPPCALLIARATFGPSLAFPPDPNFNCSPGPGLGTPGQRYCLAQLLGVKIGEAGQGPERCNLAAGV